MMADTNYLATSIVTLVAIVIVALLVKFYHIFSFFSKRKIPHYNAIRSMRAFSSCMPLALWEIHKTCGNNKIFGFYLLWKPIILIKDVELIKEVLVKQFTNFYNRGLYVNEEREPLSGHLFALEGEKWKNLRRKLSPAFTSGRTKLIFPIATKYGETLVNYISKYPENEPLECFKLTSKFTLSIISSFAFGIESDVFDNNSDFMKLSKRFMAPSFETLVRTFVLFQLKEIAHLSPFLVIPRDVTSFFTQLTKDAVKAREEGNFSREDFLQMLLQLKKTGSMDNTEADDGVQLTMNQLAAQTFVFILGGFETTALALNWGLYELALHPDIQTRLQAEIDSLGEWTYEAIDGLQYLDMVLSETLRMYPPVTFLTRNCNKNTVLEGVVIKQGMDVNISVMGIHRDPELFPKPDVFDPDRFGPNANHRIQPYSYLPFGEGPRFCIGMKTGKMQFKIGLASLMKHFTVRPTEKTSVPPVFHPKAITLHAKHGVWLTFLRRTT